MIEMRLAYLLTLVLMALLFGAGLPVLYPITAVAFFNCYWVDKFLLLNYYRPAPRSPHSRRPHSAPRVTHHVVPIAWLPDRRVVTCRLLLPCMFARTGSRRRTACASGST